MGDGSAVDSGLASGVGEMGKAVSVALDGVGEAAVVAVGGKGMPGRKTQAAISISRPAARKSACLPLIVMG